MNKKNAKKMPAAQRRPSDGSRLRTRRMRRRPAARLKVFCLHRAGRGQRSPGKRKPRSALIRLSSSPRDQPVDLITFAVTASIRLQLRKAKRSYSPTMNRLGRSVSSRHSRETPTPPSDSIHTDHVTLDPVRAWQCRSSDS